MLWSSGLDKDGTGHTWVAVDGSGHGSAWAGWFWWANEQVHTLRRIDPAASTTWNGLEADGLLTYSRPFAEADAVCGKVAPHLHTTLKELGIGPRFVGDGIGDLHATSKKRRVNLKDPKIVESLAGHSIAACWVRTPFAHRPPTATGLSSGRGPCVGAGLCAFRPQPCFHVAT